MEERAEHLVSTESLVLDPANPRLPEEMRDASQADLLRHLFETAALEEIAESYLDNGFFAHEPLIANRDDDHYVVVEGNRRLAALMVLLELPRAQEADVSFGSLVGELSSSRRDELMTVPVFVVSDRDEVRKFLGFRHIGGIRTWSAEAKARYIADEVERDSKVSDRPFYDVGRRVGSNTQGVRNSYVAISILRRARSEYGISVADIQHRRFGVWLRCMNSPDLREYIGFGDPETYGDVQQSLASLREKEAAGRSWATLSPRRGGIARCLPTRVM